LQVPSKVHKRLLTNFAAHRFRNEPFQHPNDGSTFDDYQYFLAKKNVLDFDMLVLRAADLFAKMPDAGAQIRSRWSVLLVDEFQDLTLVQYRLLHELAQPHWHIFAVGDDEQSIYSWAGADPTLFREFANDFQIASSDRVIQLRDNRRCPREVFALGRRLVANN